MVKVERKEGESFESMHRRFNRKIQQSGILLRARKLQYYVAPKSRNLQRVSARRRAEQSVVREELKKMGKFVAPKYYKRGRH